LPRFHVQRFAVAILVAVCPFVADAQIVSTHCEESEVVLSETQSVAKLERCGDDIASSLLWHLDRVDQIVPQLDGHYDRRGGGSGSIVYVMDTGVLATHGEFAGANGSRVMAGFDATSGVEIGHSRCLSDNKATAPCFDSFDELGAASHGTGVASIVAGRNVGVAPDSFVVSIRVMNERGLATTRTYLDGLDAIVRHAHAEGTPWFRTAVVNISGWVLERLSSPSSDARPAVAYATVEKKMREMIAGVDASGRPDPNGRRFLFVVAANNVDGGCGASGVIDRFPALLGRNIEGMITVGGMTQHNTTWTGTCRGGVEVLAPAQGIFSASITAPDHYRGRRPNQRNGTSFAAPVISGIAARLLSDRPDLTPQQLEAWITATPSRVDNPDSLMADGKVAFVQSIAPAAPAATRASLEP
jgi:subtilisin family serine protease